MKELIEQRKIIDIDTAPNTDNVYTGICLVANSEIVMLLNFNEESGEFDGFTIIKNDDFEQYSVWEEDEYSEVKNDNSESLIAAIDVNDFPDLETAFRTLQSELVSIFTYEDEDAYWVGKVLSVTKEEVELHLITEDAEWSDPVFIEFKDISYLGFATLYEKELLKKACL